MPPPGAPGSSKDRTAFIREKLAAEKLSAESNVGVSGGRRGGGEKGGSGEGREGEAVEELVGDAGADAMSKMLSSFDDSDDEA